MTIWIRWLLLFCLGWGAPGAGAATKTQARLLLAADTARPGDTVTAAIQLTMAPKWHTYWRYGGDSGIPTKVEWTLPAGVTAGELQWPPPEKYVAEGLTTYVYHDQVLLLVPLKLADNVAAGPLNLQAKVSWLECEAICLPGEAQIQAALKVGDATAASEHAGLIETWRKKLPQDGSAQKARAFWDGKAAEDKRALLIEWITGTAPASADFYPYSSDASEVGAASDQLPADAGKVLLRKKANKLNDAWPTLIAGILVDRSGKDTPVIAYEVKLPIAAGADTVAVASAPASGSAANGPAVKPKGSLAKMLFYAFLGGLILNIMPCVLPVIALKILGFVNQSKEDPARVRMLGLIYALGVLCSFLLMAVIIIGVQQAGQSAGWGMQFANPKFLVFMTVLVTLVALNLFGLFEVNLGGGAMTAAGELACKEGGSGAFFHGVLATAMATPCTAPFLAPALGFAFSQPPWVVILMFLTIGAGLSAPYVVLSWEPGWLKYLPRPGAWMGQFKVAMGFPMLATAIWMFWLTSKHFGDAGVLWFGLFLVALALALWVWGEFVQRGGKRRGLAMAISLLLVAFGYSYAMEKELRWRSPASHAAADGVKRQHPGGIAWEPWSLEAVAKARAEGRPILVDFTADWCLTCNVNKKTSIEIPSVEAKLKEINAVVLLGDHTLQPPAITAELKKFDRAGVPLVLVYPKQKDAPPIVLPEVLTPGIVLNALDKAVKDVN